MEREALFDPTFTYRYLLRRTWDVRLPLAVFVMLNPSTADAERDDPTIRRCIGLTRAWGFGRLEVVNLFGYRTPHPTVLAAAADPVGPENDVHVLQAAARGDLVVAAWGNAGAILQRGALMLPHLVSAARLPLQCLGQTRTGHPRHPLYVPAASTPHPLTPRQFTISCATSEDRRGGRSH
jgi:hypothetical protein